MNLNIFVHLRIGHQIYQRLQKDSIKINRLGFLIGNILPDLQPKRINAEHYFEDSWNTVQNLADKIGSNFRKNELGRLTGWISLDIGMMCHFTADYFCYAHMPQYRQNIILHLIYEASMMPYFAEAANHFQNSKVLCYQITPDWKDTLPQIINEHQTLEPSIIRDLDLSLENGLFLVRQLLKEVDVKSLSAGPKGTQSRKRIFDGVL